MKPRALLLGGAACAALCIPAAAQAATKSVWMGLPPSAMKSFGETNTANDFFPHGITIHAGDTVAFVPVGFHNVDFPVKGGKPLELLAPTGEKVAGVNDAAGAAFWFNGLDQFGFNPAVATADGYGKTASYNGKTAYNSGLPLAEKPKPASVKFPKTGTFTYYCDVHPGMTGKVHVVGKKAKAPSKKADAKVVKQEVARDLKELKRVLKYKAPAGQIQIGAAGAHGVEAFAFFPAAPTAKVGDTVTFSMPVSSGEVHTATAGPGDIEDDTSYLGGIAASFEAPVLDPRAVYPSDFPGNGPASLTTTLHGNGFWSSGVLDTIEASTPPSANQVTFAEAGSFTFYCLVHPFMKATVTVSS